MSSSSKHCEWTLNLTIYGQITGIFSTLFGKSISLQQLRTKLQIRNKKVETVVIFGYFFFGKLCFRFVFLSVPPD